MVKAQLEWLKSELKMAKAMLEGIEKGDTFIHNGVDRTADSKAEYQRRIEMLPPIIERIEQKLDDAE